MAKFQKGQSGNPGGRPKESNEVKALARQHGPEAVQRLADWMKSDNPKASVSASQALLDRAYGKPTQTVAGDPEHPLKVMTEVGLALDAKLDRLIGRKAGAD